MMISTKGRYALSVMIDLAQHADDGFVSLREISERQGISMKYLEMIVAILNKANFVQSLRGKEGGYKMVKPASDYTAGSILKLVEGSLAPVSCMNHKVTLCANADGCLTFPMWRKLDQLIDDYLEGVTVEDLITGRLS